MRNQEEEVQKGVVKYLKLMYPSARYCASLGGIRTSYKQAVKAKATGYVKGFPDLQICVPMERGAIEGGTLEGGGIYHGLFLEIKKDKKSYPTKEQKEWIAYLNEQGYCARVTKGLDESIEVIDNYFNKRI
ncbi:MAG: hypothetical protein Unbinned8210contig1002_45 [Prokaryotic dsDNA virus sp.]|nr:MAG: hypothetical protein Unbinned8210contig1002_45 [Prokaryotic dsDNA virus sp.]